MSERAYLQDRFKVGEIGIFGSFARGDQDEKSDMDILVDFSDDTMSLFDVIEMKHYLEDKPGAKVDIVTRIALKPEIGKCIMEEVMYI
ncbi:MAG: nucleotidyltransferase family protein [Spirochaetia bacterium]|nr:nucleotidyltransferase family protein [Spirochaetia bacterium]